MQEQKLPPWITWAREIQALAQTSDFYAENHFQQERYQRLKEIAAEIIAGYTGLPPAGLVKTFNRQNGYATPKIDVRGAVFQGEKILLVQEALDGGWTLPGGWVDVEDSPSGAVEREVREEAGFEVKAMQVIGVYDANRAGELALFHAFKLLFLCELVDGEARSSYETSAVGFFGQNEIPQPFSGERTAARHIEDAFRAYQNPDSPAVFD